MVVAGCAELLGSQSGDSTISLARSVTISLKPHQTGGLADPPNDIRSMMYATSSTTMTCSSAALTRVMDASISVGEVELRDEYAFVGMLPSQSRDKVEYPGEAPPINHLGVLVEVYPVVDGVSRPCHREGRVMSEPELHLPCSVCVRRPLLDHAGRLDEHSWDPLDLVSGYGQGESGSYVLLEQPFDLVHVLLRRLVVAVAQGLVAPCLLLVFVQLPAVQEGHAVLQHFPEEREVVVPPQQRTQLVVIAKLRPIGDGGPRVLADKPVQVELVRLQKGKVVVEVIRVFRAEHERGYTGYSGLDLAIAAPSPRAQLPAQTRRRVP